jgi:hypothetical protein
MHRVLIGVVVTGAVIIAGIGFAGSYAAVRKLAVEKGFGNFSYVFPIGIDAGICVLLALDLLLTWIRIPFPLLRQTAWVLTAATIAFNGAAAWPDPLGVGMHAVIPVLFVVSVEAARHAVGRIADITADKHMEGVRLTRWMLSPLPTFLLWRRMKLWELRSYEQVIKLEQERLVYQARLRSRFGRAWRRKAPVESLMPLRLARYGVPLAQTASSGLAAAGIEPAVLPSVSLASSASTTSALEQGLGEGAVAGAGAGASGGGRPELAGGAGRTDGAGQGGGPGRADDGFGAVEPRGYEAYDGPGGFEGYEEQLPPDVQDEQQSPWFRPPRDIDYQGGYDPSYDPAYGPEDQYEQWYEEQPPERFEAPAASGAPASVSASASEETGSFPIPAGPNRTRELGEGGASPVVEPNEDNYYAVFKQSINGSYPTPREFGDNVEAEFGNRLAGEEAKRLVTRFTARHTAELEDDHIA